MSIGHFVPYFFVASQVIGRHGMETRIVRMFGDIVQAKADIGAHIGSVCTIDQTGLKCGEDLVEVHHNG